MKILIGSIMRETRWSSNLALDIPGIGVLEAKRDKHNDPFSCITLTKKQLIKLRDRINQEIGE